jgi:hypothetical protein
MKTNRFRFPEHKEFYFFFLFKRLMYVTEKGGGMSAALGKTSFEEGFIVMLSYFVSQNGVIKMIFYL